MKLLVENEGEELAVEIVREGERLRAVCDGRSYELIVRAPEPDIFLLIHDNHVYECRVDRKEAAKDFSVQLKGQRYDVAINDPKKMRRGAHADRQVSGGRAQIVAQMPGKVVRVLVSEGVEVAAGDSLIVVEAMKMQNEMKSPKSGIAREIRVAAGATVSAGEVLAVIE